MKLFQSKQNHYANKVCWCSISERVREGKSESVEESLYNAIVSCVISIVDSWVDARQSGV